MSGSRNNLVIEGALEEGEARRALEEAGLGASLTPEQRARLGGFFELRARWGGTHNLSGPQALADLRTDLIDAVAAWGVMEGDAPLAGGGARPLADIGSGSGAPGLLVACLDPARPLWLVEPLAKRCAFLRTAAHQLGLEEVRVFRERWPSAQVDALGPCAAVSRAVVSPEEWPPLAARPQVSAVVQLLAHKRPEWPLAGFSLAAEVRYVAPDGGERLARRWERG